MKNVFANRLKQARIMQGFSMEQLCNKMNNIITRQSISKYEIGKMMPDSTTLISKEDKINIAVQVRELLILYQTIWEEKKITFDLNLEEIEIASNAELLSLNSFSA